MCEPLRSLHENLSANGVGVEKCVCLPRGEFHVQIRLATQELTAHGKGRTVGL